MEIGEVKKVMFPARSLLDVHIHIYTQSRCKEDAITKSRIETFKRFIDQNTIISVTFLSGENDAGAIFQSPYCIIIVSPSLIIWIMANCGDPMKCWTCDGKMITMWISLWITLSTYPSQRLSVSYQRPFMNIWPPYWAETMQRANFKLRTTYTSVTLHDHRLGRSPYYMCTNPCFFMKYQISFYGYVF